jgi:hypothetical protein
VVPDSGLSARLDSRLNEHEIEPQREVWQRPAVRKPAAVEQPESGLPHPAPLPPVERFLRQPEFAPRAPADLDGHEGPARARVDGDDVQLVTADVEVPGEDRPAEGLEAGGDQSLGGIA